MSLSEFLGWQKVRWGLAVYTLPARPALAPATSAGNGNQLETRPFPLRELFGWFVFFRFAEGPPKRAKRQKDMGTPS